MRQKNVIMTSEAIERALMRIAHEIVEKHNGIKDVIIIGIQRRGVPLANKIAEKIEKIENEKVPVGILDITFYRDDLSLLAQHPIINGTDIPFDVTGKQIVMVDDVLYTGRTARAAMDALMDLGRPNTIQLAILIDRGHRELPIRADYVGKNVPTSKKEVIGVHVQEIDGKQEAVIYDVD